MTDAPERIWMDMSDDAIRARGRPYVTQGYLAAPPRTEYLRADLCDRDAILEEAAKAVEEYADKFALGGLPHLSTGAIVAAVAIRAMKEAK